MSATERIAVICGMVAGPLFLLAFTLIGAVTDGYSPVRHDVSGLELAEHGWVQRLAFVVAGALTLILSVAVYSAYRPISGRLVSPELRGSRCGPILISMWGLSLIGSGLFVTDPTGGFPPGTAIDGGPATWHGALHNLAAGFGFGSLLAAMIIFTRMYARRGQRGWVIYTVFSAVVLLSSIIIASYGASRSGGVSDLGGLFQRVAGVSAMAWLTVLAVELGRSPSQPSDRVNRCLS